MANWIMNEVRANGIKNLDIFTEIPMGTVIDFNKVIPEPEPKNEQWRIENWGSFADADVDDDDYYEKDPDRIMFDTPDVPYKIIAKLSTMLPGQILIHDSTPISDTRYPITRAIWLDGKMVKAYRAVFKTKKDRYGSFRHIKTDSLNP